MDNKEFIIRLRKEFKKLSGFKENDSHFIIQCPQCESDRDMDRHGHLYISKLKVGCPSDCKKCSLSLSKISEALLNNLGISDPELLSYVRTNFKIKHSHIINVDERNRKLTYEVPSFTLKKDKLKIETLSDRLMYDIDNEEDITRYRIITNLSKFIKKNNIDMSTLSKKEQSLITLIDNCYIGFLSYFGNIINFRNMTGNEDKCPRFIKFNINKELKRAYFYTPALKIDPLTIDPKITVAEGDIDVIAIHLNNKSYDINNNLYVATSSLGGFRSAIKNALMLTGFYGCTINLYLDNDEEVDRVSKYDFTKIIKSLNGFGKNFKFNAFINLSDKDFGDLTKNITIGRFKLTNYLN